MSALAVLANAHLVPFSKFNATSLYTMKNGSSSTDIESLIMYYHALQCTENNTQFMSKILMSTNERNINRIIERLGYGPVVICMRSSTGTGHSIVVYKKETGSWKKDGVTYTSRFLTYDPSYPEGGEDTYIYYNPSTYAWKIPVYENKYDSKKGAKFKYVSSSPKRINRYGCLNIDGTISETVDDMTEVDAEYIAEEEDLSEYGDTFIASLNAKEAEDYSVSKATATASGYIEDSNDDGIIPAQFDTMEGEDGETTGGYYFMDSNSAYKLTQYETLPLELTMEYENSRLEIQSAAGKSALFDSDGSVELVNEASDFTVNAVYNDEMCVTDWYKIGVSGENTNSVKFTPCDDGYILSSDNLSNVSVNAENYDVTTSVDFSTTYDSVKIYEIDQHTIGINVDEDGDGTYETLLATGTGSDIEYTDDVSETVYGDANQDNAINLADVVVLSKCISGSLSLTTSAQSNADVNSDSAITASDAAIIARFLVGSVSTLPYTA